MDQVTGVSKRWRVVGLLLLTLVAFLSLPGGSAGARGRLIVLPYPSASAPSASASSIAAGHAAQASVDHDLPAFRAHRHPGAPSGRLVSALTTGLLLAALVGLALVAFVPVLAPASRASRGTRSRAPPLVA